MDKNKNELKYEHEKEGDDEFTNKDENNEED